MTWIVFAQQTIIGLTLGGTFALAALGITLVYRVTGVLNFANGAMGMFSTFVAWQIAYQWHQPWWVAILGALAFSLLLGLVLENAVFRWLAGREPLTKAVVTVGLLLSLQAAASLIWGSTDYHLPIRIPGTDRVLPVFGVPIGYDQMLIIGAALALSGGLAALLRFSRLGIAMRAVSEDPDVAQVWGVPVNLVGSVSWMLGSAVAAIAGILITPFINFDTLSLTVLVLDALAAALIGGLVSLPLTVAGGFALGLLETYPKIFISSLGFPKMVALAVIVAVLVIRQRALVGKEVARVAGHAARQAVATASGHGVPRPARIAGGLFVLAVAAVVPYFTNDIALRFDAAIAVVFGFAILSLVVLTGYVGQISLCQATFVGMSAFTTSWFFDGFGWNYFLAALVGIGASFLLGILVGIPALRLKGITLAIVTAGVALAFDYYVFQDPAFGFFTGGRGGWRVDQVTIGRLVLDGRDHLLYVYWILIAVFALVSVLVVNLHDSGSGRRFRSIRDSEVAASTMGVDVTRYKLLAFGLSAAIAGIGGAFYPLVFGAVSASPFSFFYSLQFAAFAVLMGIRFVPAAALAGFFMAFVPEFLQRASEGRIKYDWFNLVLGALLALQLIFAPDGVWGDLVHRAGQLTSRPGRPRKPIAPAEPPQPAPQAAAP